MYIRVFERIGEATERDCCCVTAALDMAQDLGVVNAEQGWLNGCSSDMSSSIRITRLIPDTGNISTHQSTPDSLNTEN
jgi:hypothetical protein